MVARRAQMVTLHADLPHHLSGGSAYPPAPTRAVKWLIRKHGHHVRNHAQRRETQFELDAKLGRGPDLRGLPENQDGIHRHFALQQIGCDACLFENHVRVTLQLKFHPTLPDDYPFGSSLTSRSPTTEFKRWGHQKFFWNRIPPSSLVISQSLWRSSGPHAPNSIIMLLAVVIPVEMDVRLLIGRKWQM